MTVCCTPGYTGLGQVDPGTLMAINEAFVDAKRLWDDIKRIFGIGAGAREADVITPLQDKIHTTVLAPTVEMGMHPELHTCSEMQQQLGVLKGALAGFENFLNTQEWQDGRAAQQALYWMKGGNPPAGSEGQEPTAFLVLRDFTEDVQQKCGSVIGGGGIFTDSLGNINWPVLALGAGVLFMALRRK